MLSKFEFLESKVAFIITLVLPDIELKVVQVYVCHQLDFTGFGSFQVIFEYNLLYSICNLHAFMKTSSNTTLFYQIFKKINQISSTM